MAASKKQASDGKPEPLSNDEPEKDPGTKTNYRISGHAQPKPPKSKDPIPDTGKTHYKVEG